MRSGEDKREKRVQARARQSRLLRFGLEELEGMIEKAGRLYDAGSREGTRTLKDLAGLCCVIKKEIRALGGTAGNTII